MLDNTYKKLVILLYSLSFLILVFCLKVRLNPNIYLKTNIKIILLLIICLSVYISGYILVKKLKYNKKILKINLIIYFLLYIIFIFSLTLFDEAYGRQGFNFVKWNKNLIDVYIKTSFNIIPFKTIKLFINGYLNNLVTFKDFISNIFGNFFVFMPFSFFIPSLIPRINRYFRFIIIMFVIILFIELLQFLTLSGSCDIDDLILNILGCTISYFVFKIKIINNFIQKIFFLN